MTKNGPGVSRRRFLRSAARGVAAGGLALLCRALLGPGRGEGPRPFTCPVAAGCRHCPALAGCGRREARSFRRAQTRRIPRNHEEA
jgi:hypothetical protein